MAPAVEHAPVDLVDQQVKPARTPRSRSFPPGTTRKWIFWIVIVIYLAARLWHLAAVCLDGDEIFSVGISGYDWKGVTASAAADAIHPPLFYYLLKIWMAIGGDSLYWVRLLPALFSWLAVLPMYYLCVELRLRRVEINCVLGVAAIHPFLIYYSQHVRMYSLLLLCGLTSLWLFQRALKRVTRPAASGFIALTIANIALVHSHYYGWLIVGLECWYVVFWRRSALKKALFSAATVFVAFIPWFYTATTHAIAKGGLASNLEWIQKPTLKDLYWCYGDLAGFGETPAVAPRFVRCMALLVLLLAVAIWRQRRRLYIRSLGRVVRFLLFFVVSPVAISFAASSIMPQSVWGDRHLIFVAVPLLVLCTVACYRLRSTSVRLLGTLLCASWACLVIHHQFSPTDKKVPFDALVVQMLAQERATAAPTTFYSLDKYLHYPVWFYLEILKAGRNTGFAVPLGDRGQLRREASLVVVKPHATIEDAQAGHFWIGYSSDSWRQRSSPQAVLIQRGCRTGADLKVGDWYHTITAFPVWCGLGAPSTR